MLPILGKVMQTIALVIIAVTIYLVVKRYQTHATLFLSGFALLITAHFARSGSGAPGMEESLTGLFAFDLFAMVSEAFSNRVARIGMIIMAAGGAVSGAVSKALKTWWAALRSVVLQNP